MLQLLFYNTPCGCSPAACNYSYLLQLLVLQPHLDASSAAANPFGSKFTHAAATPSCYNYFCCIVPCGCSPAACKCFYLLQLLVLQPHLVAATASAALCPVGAHQQHATTPIRYHCLCCSLIQMLQQLLLQCALWVLTSSMQLLLFATAACAAASSRCYNCFCCNVPCGCSPAACNYFKLLLLLVLQCALWVLTSSSSSGAAVAAASRGGQAPA